MRQSHRAVALILLILVPAPLAAQGSEPQDWPRYRGPQQDGSSPGNGVLDRDPMGLAVDWKRPLGSGYSSISVAVGHGVTMFTDGKDDLLVAFDAATGEERWRYRIAEMYEGHSGSDDGPISTPAIAGGAVYGLGPRGQLFAVRLGDGGEVWSRTLGEGDSVAPYYGYATAPVVAGDLLVVETGGPEGHSISAFDRQSGEPRWSVGDDPVNYQSPAVIELAGRTQVVAINDKMLHGIAPESGEILWQHEHGTDAVEAFTQPLALGDDRLLVNSLSEAAAFEVQAAGDGFEIAELWRANVFQRSYAIPVLHGGHLYGFNSRFLTAVDAATGEVAWKSRPPGGQGLILVDGQLVILSPGGEVVVAEASPAGYRERARLAVFDDGGLTPASFAGGRIFVRNLEEMAAIRVTDAPVAVAEGLERELRGAFGEMVRRAEAAGETERRGLVDEYLSPHQTMPIVEGDDLVHFVYRGEVDDIALAGNFLPFREEVPMDRIAGTDVYFKSFTLDPEAVWEYRYNVNFGDLVADPANPHPIGSIVGPSSELRMPRFKVPAHLGEPEGERGRLDSFQLRSEIRGNERRIRLYLPPGYEASGDARYPLLVMPHRDSALDDGRIDQALDQLIAGGKVAPLLAVFIERQRDEYRAPGAAAQYVRMLTEELIPLIDRHYRTAADPDSRALLGAATGGSVAIYAALKANGFFGQAAAQSAIVRQPFTDELPALIAAEDQRPLRFRLEIRRHDLVVEGASIDAAAESRQLAADLGEAGYDVEVRELAGAWGWSSWRAELDDVLRFLFPPAEEE